MSSLQKDHVSLIKRETILNVEVLSKVRPMSSELRKLILKGNPLDKPTQSLFYHLTHYLVSIIDKQPTMVLPWPLYDSKTERDYRNKLSAFINEFSSKGLLSSVMSSYLVNPGCYKVTLLMFQMSQIGVQRVLESKMCEDRQKCSYHSVTQSFKSGESFTDVVNQKICETNRLLRNHSHKQDVMLQIAELVNNRLEVMEKKLKAMDCQKYLDGLVDGYLEKHQVDEYTKSEILKIKDVSTESAFFESWLLEMDSIILNMETEWNNRMGPFVKLLKNTQSSSELLINRLMGDVDKESYILEYNPSDYICTKNLQSQVNSQQKYILKNIVNSDKLIFPNLIRAYVIAIDFILKNTVVDDEIYKFNEYLEGGSRNIKEIVNAMDALLNRVMNADARLQLKQKIYEQSPNISKELSEIPPLPNLSDLKMVRDQSQLILDSFTPLNLTRHQFNLHRRFNKLARPQPRSLITPYHAPRDDFLKSLISCHTSSYNRHNMTQNLNISMISNVRNETIAECSSGFTKQQIMRLLSTKKSSSKKFKYKTERPKVNVIKGGLFNESHTPNLINHSPGLHRSYSSPNLFESREKRSRIDRKLSMMHEDCLLEVSGITALDKDSFGTPDSVQLECSRKLLDATSLPIISVSPPNVKTNIMKDVPLVPNKVHFAEFNFENIVENIDAKTATPKNTTQPIRKTSSLEKIINRFKKVRANVLPEKNMEDTEFKTILEEKENLNNINVDVTANRVLLPDLLSPSCSTHMKKSTDYLEELCMDMDAVSRRRPRESLGTALGVDHTFLDQFDLID